jgi:hypothetical protein
MINATQSISEPIIISQQKITNTFEKTFSHHYQKFTMS